MNFFGLSMLYIFRYNKRTLLPVSKKKTKILYIMLHIYVNGIQEGTQKGHISMFHKYNKATIKFQTNLS